MRKNLINQIQNVILVTLFTCIIITIGLIPHIGKNMHGELEMKEDTDSDEVLFLYHSNYYYATDTWLSSDITEDDVQIGWSYAFPFPNFYYYTDRTEEPLYILCGGDSYTRNVYLQEGYDFTKQKYIVEGTDIEFVFAEEFTKIETDVRPENYLAGIEVSFCLKDEPRLKINRSFYQIEGMWYFIRDGECYFLSDELVRLLQEDKILASDTSYEHDDNSTEGLVGINKLRVDYDLGTCQDLSGNISVILFFMDDFESSWTDDEIINFINNEVEPGLEFLEREAKSYDVELDLIIQQSYSSLFYDDEVILDVRETGFATVDVLDQAARGLDYFSDDEMIAGFKYRYGTEVVCFTIFNKKGTGYAINPHRGTTLQIEEHSVIFTQDLNSNYDDSIGSHSSIVVHEMLHLFGAEDLYTPANRKILAKKYYPTDIMLSTNYSINTNIIGDATAFYIGWTDEVPKVLFSENWYR